MGINDGVEKESQNMLFRIVGNIWQKYYELQPKFVRQFFDAIEKTMAQPYKGTWKVWVQNLKETDRCEQDTVDEIKKLLDFPFPLNMIYFGMTVFKTMGVELETILSVYGLDRQYDILGNTTPHPAPVGDLVRAMIIDPGRTNENRKELKKHGFSETQIDNIVLAQYRTLDEGTLRTLWLRKLITEERLFERMRELGYTDTRTKELVQTWEVIPGPQDLFHMVAKEAFEPTMVSLMGLQDEFPVDQLEHLEKQGINKFWAEHYWSAHWDQPSIGQGFEMLHRDVINLEQLDMLFRTVEIPPFWRDKLTQIAYKPLTRVDIRRMFEMDVIDEAKVYESYKYFGYDHDNAVAMTDFSIEFKHNKEKELTRSAILQSFGNGMIPRPEAKALLMEQDYSDDLAEFYLVMEEYKQDLATQNLQMDNVKEEYLLSIATEASTRDRLNRMGLRGEKINALLEGWFLDAYKYQLLPSKSHLDGFLVKGIITQDQWRQTMSRHGFNPAHINWYWEELQPALKISGRNPTKADIGSWYKKNTITESEYYDYMRDLGYADPLIDNYFKSL